MRRTWLSAVALLIVVTTAAAARQRRPVLERPNPAWEEFTRAFDRFMAADGNYTLVRDSAGAERTVANGPRFRLASGARPTYLPRPLKIPEPGPVDASGGRVLTRLTAVHEAAASEVESQWSEAVSLLWCCA